MNNNSRSEKKKLITSSVYCLVICVMLVLSVIMFASGSMAWFANSNASNSSGMGISADRDTDIMVKQVRILKYDMEKELAKIIDEDVYNNMTLNEYDTVFEERQTYTAMILEVTLENTAGSDFSVSINNNGELFEGEQDQVEESKKKIEANISNLVHFKCTTSLALQSINENNPNLYLQVKEHFDTNNDLQKQTFVNYTMENGVFAFEETKKNNNVTFNIEREDGNKNDEVKLYIYINYDTELMEEYLERKWGTNSTTEIFSESNKVKLEKDVEFVIFDKVS